MENIKMAYIATKVPHTIALQYMYYYKSGVVLEIKKKRKTELLSMPVLHINF